MRWTALVVLLLAGCGGDDAGDQAPDCDIPPKVCADGSGPVASRSDVADVARCLDASGGYTEQWLTYDAGHVQYGGTDRGQTVCWTASSTVALRRVYESDVAVDDCWDRNGEPADCAVVLEEINAASQPQD